MENYFFKNDYNAALQVQQLEEAPCLALNNGGTEKEAKKVARIEHFTPVSEDYTENKIQTALGFIDPNLGYGQWTEDVLCGLRHQFANTPEQGFKLFDEWSSKGEEYPGPVETRKKWDSFTPSPDRVPKTIRSLILLAQKNGYEPPKINPATNKDEPKTVYLPRNGIKGNHTAEAIAYKLKPLNCLFNRSDNLVTVQAGRLETFSLSRPFQFGNLVERHLNFKAWVSLKEQMIAKPTKPPAEDLKRIMESRDLIEGLNPISQVLNQCYLILNESGEIEQLNIGYNPASGVFVTSGGVDTEEVEIQEAIEALKDIHSEFNFVTEADRSRAVAMLLTPAMKVGGFVEDRIPADFAEASESQSGKGYRHQLIRSIYREGSETVTMKSKDGGVGSFDEKFSKALAGGSLIVCMDNLRGSLDSQLLESYMTAHPTRDSVQIRPSYSPSISVKRGNTVLQMSSNGLHVTEDLANRCCLIRITKHDDAFRFKTYPEGDLLKHVEANNSFYMGCVNAVIREWHAQGMKSEQGEHAHDFREWHGKLNWIITELFGMPPMMEGHRKEQKRTSSSAETFLRRLFAKIVSEGQHGKRLSPSELVNYCDSPKLPNGSDVTSRGMGSFMASKIGEGEMLELEQGTIERHYNGNQNFYTFRTPEDLAATDAEDLL
jgi:hypothetical protein